MKRAVLCLLFLSIYLSLTATSHAQCSVPTVTSFSISPGTILGDGSEFAIATVGACLPSGTTNLSLYIDPSGFSASQTVCYGGGLVSNGCNYLGVGSGNVQVSFATNGINQTGSTENGSISINAYNGPPIFTEPLTVTSVANPYEPPSSDPEGSGPCGGGGGGSGGGGGRCGSAGSPINVLNGNTWIPQQDYFMPGIGGGLTLTRTWNSLWANANPPETAGIFGDSWRSTFEERIQVVSGSVFRYWKGNGNSLFYGYNSGQGTYYLTAPLDDQTTLSYNSVTSVWTITEKDGTKRNFNGAGYLTSIVDLNGNTTTISVDANNQNRIASITDASGHVLTFNYADANNPRLCTSISDSVGTFTQYAYDDATKRLTQVTYPDSSQYKFTYNDPDSNTLISLVTDSAGKTIEAHTYDSSRRGLSSQQANDSNGNAVNKVTVRYGSPNSWENFVCDSTGDDCITVQVSNRNQRLYISLTSGPSNNACNTCGFTGKGSATFDSTGYPTSSVDGNGNITLYSYNDSSGNLLSQSQRDQFDDGWDTWNYTYNSFGEVLTATDPLGLAGDPNHTTTNVYNAQGNLTSVTTPSPDNGITAGSVTSFTPNAQGQVTKITDPLSNATNIVYCTTNQTNCPYGLIYYIKDAKQNKTTYSYDGRGNRLSITDALSHVTSFQYDPMNRVTLITYPTSPATTVQLHYDWRGRRDYVIDQDSNKTSYGYDDADRLLTVTDAQSPTNGITTYAYDTENNLTDIYDAKNDHTQFVYLPGKILYETTFPSTEYETYSFDDDNNLEYKTDRNNHTINYNYDYQNHLYRKVYPDGNSLTYTYDPAGRLTQVQDSATGTYTFGYDNMNRLGSAGVDYSFSSAGTLTVQYGYDKASNRTSMTDPQSVPTTYGYDILNRLTGLTYNGQTPNFTFGYNALSLRTSLTRPNSVDTTYAYDPVSRLTSVLHKLGTTTLDGATYTYDKAGNRLTRTDKRLSTTLTYGYDNIYQLQSAKQGSTTKETYSYDLVGNRLTSLGVSPYDYNSSNELTSTPSGSYTYDANGNTLSDPTGKSYTWDFENRLTQAVVPGTGTVAFKYDPFGRRIQKSSPLGTTNYLYDGTDSNANLLEEMDGAGNVLARYTQQLDVDRPLSMLRSGAISYYEQDGLGSVTSLSNSAGTLVNTYAYDSFGKLTASTGTLVNPFQYTGREFDSETGLYEYRARYYDQNVGRFKSEDPIRFKGGINFYAYVGNNATNRTDPDGMAFKTCAKALEDLTKAQYEADKRLVQFLAHGDGDAQHAKQLGIALKNLNEAIDQVVKYCKCEAATAAVAIAVGVVAKIVEALQQFCSGNPVCAMAKNEGDQFHEHKGLPLYAARADIEPGQRKVLGHAVTTSMNR
jgi:RHS repeat-associated protein